MGIAIWSAVGLFGCAVFALYGLYHTIQHRNDMRAMGRVHQ